MTTTPPPKDSFAVTLFHAGSAAVSWLADTAGWIGGHGPLLLLCAASPAIAAAVVHRRLSQNALAQRQRFILTPTRRFDPTPEDIWRQTAVLLRAADKGPWWAPRATKRVRIRLRADGSTPLEYSLEAHTDAVTLLSDSRYRDVSVAKAPPADDPVAAQAEADREDKKSGRAKKRKAAEKAQRKERKTAGDPQDAGQEEKDGRLHTVRAEFVLRGRPAAALREVPLEPDPLQPIIDAVADIKTELGELAEVVLDLQSVPAWQLRLRQWQLVHEAREKGRARARKAAGHAAADAAEAQDSLRYQLATLFESGSNKRPPMMPLPRPQPLDPAKALGRLGSSQGLVRIQLLVRCASEFEGRARQNLSRLTAAMDVFAEGSRLGQDGGRFLWLTWGADSWHRRASFDRRWSSGEVAPRAQNWLNVSELQGLLKPPTMHSELPVLATELPTYELGKALVPHGHLEGPDGSRRLIATPAAENLFSVKVGKSNYGKTELAMVQALALALAGEGVLFIDPHGDSWRSAAPVLANSQLSSRVLRIDLANAEEPGARIPSWNMLGVEHGQNAAPVISAAVDAIATALSWTDAAAPRAITILTKAVEALVEYNRQAVDAGRPDAQATLHQIRTLLTDEETREAVLSTLNDDQRRWWETTYTKLPPDSFGPVTNPLDRLAANPVTRAFLGSPVGAYDIRAAMEDGKIVWLCLEGTGPSDRLLISMIMQDLLRAGLSRRDTAEDKRKPFHIFADELISLDPAGGPTFAAITEQLRKFKARLHVMVQHLNRVAPATRESLLQNSSVLSTTAGATAAIKAVSDEWHGAVAPEAIAELRRFEHYVEVTVNGAKVGPLLVKGPQVQEVFEDLLSPHRVKSLAKQADSAAGGKPFKVLLRVADGQDAAVLRFLEPMVKQVEPRADEQETTPGAAAVYPVDLAKQALGQQRAAAERPPAGSSGPEGRLARWTGQPQTKPATRDE